MGLNELPRRIALDTSIFIYFIERHERFRPIVRPLFEDADAGRRVLVTSAITLLEVMVAPYRAKNMRLIQEYESLLTNSSGIEIVDLSRDQLDAAARIRAATSVKTPDALQLAAAASAECEVFLTNDRRLQSLPGLRVVDLGALAPAGLHDA